MLVMTIGDVVEIGGFGYWAVRMLTTMRMVVMILPQTRQDGADRNHTQFDDDDDENETMAVMASSWHVFSCDWTKYFNCRCR